MTGFKLWTIGVEIDLSVNCPIDVFCYLFDHTPSEASYVGNTYQIKLLRGSNPEYLDLQALLLPLNLCTFIHPALRQLKG